MNRPYFNSVEEWGKYTQSKVYSGATEILGGTAMAFKDDRGTATDIDTEANAFVEIPDSGSYRSAGVIARADGLPSVQVSREQELALSIPESGVLVQCPIPTTKLVTLLNPTIATGIVGQFLEGILTGRGAAIALQTVANLADTDTNLVGPVSQGLTGAGALTASTKTLTESGKFTYAAAGDRVIVLGGARTSNGDSSVVTVGEYLVVTRSSANAVILNASPATQDSNLTYIVVRGKPMVPALMLDGPDEVGFIEFLSPNAGAAVSAKTSGGTHFICGGYTIGSDSTFTLADGTIAGILHAFAGLGTLTTSGYVVTVTTGVKRDGSNLATFTINTADDVVVVRNLKTIGTATWNIIANSKGATMA